MPGSPESESPTREDSSAPRSRFANVDPADIDRYLGGRPPRSKAGSSGPRQSRESQKPGAGTSSGAGTARQLERLQQSVNRASKSRREPPETARSGKAQTDDDFEVVPTASSQTAYAAESSSVRSNQRRNVMRQDPYVTETDYDEADQYDQNADVDDIDYLDQETGREEPRRRRASRPAFQRPNIQKPTLPPAIANADIVNDASALAFVGVSCLSLAGMAIVVANRIEAVNPVIATHVSASGVLEHFASRSTIWQLPLLATMLTLMNLVAAWLISPLDRFASRFLLATSVIVQFVAWVAVLRILW